MSTSCGYTPDELLAVGFTHEDVGIVIMTCPAGEYYNLEQAACWKCLSGTYANMEGERIGENALVSGCTQKCDPGYITKSGAVSKGQCFLGYRVNYGDAAQASPVSQAAASASESFASGVAWCSGAFQTLENKCAFKNQGLGYITSRSECTRAAELIMGTGQKEDVQKGLGIMYVPTHAPHHPGSLWCNP